MTKRLKNGSWAIFSKPNQVPVSAPQMTVPELNTYIKKKTWLNFPLNFLCKKKVSPKNKGGKPPGHSTRFFHPTKTKFSQQY